MRLTIGLFFLMLITSCEKAPFQPTMNCPAFKRGMLQKDATTVGSEIRKLTFDLFPNPIPLDSIGHLKNISVLTSRINNSCNFSARGICYLCIPGNPPQSEVEVTFASSTVDVVMSFTLVVDENNMLRVQEIF